MDISKIIRRYDLKKLTLGVLGSHSALDICSGAKKFGFKTLVVAQKGRDLVYSKHYKTADDLGCVDDCIIVDSFKELLRPNLIKQLTSKNTIFIPHRSFEVYLNFNYPAIEKKFTVPMFGNRYLLKIEERGVKPNQYDLLEKAGIRFPQQFKNPREINRLCLVKVLEKERGFERAFFLANNYNDFQSQAKKKLKKSIFTKDQLEHCIIEEFILGSPVNFNFFYSPINKRLELLGTDTRRQTNLDGILRIPANYQSEILQHTHITYEESGHIAVTVLESLLEKAFELGEKFVKATQKMFSPGVIGPFALQSIITSGPPKKDIVVVDVSPRIPGSPGISATPYSYYLYGKHLSVGERISMEISKTLQYKKLLDILT